MIATCNMARSSPMRGASSLGGNANPETSATRRLGVLGIGLIMEEVGKGARLVFRYPASPPPSFFDQSACAANNEESNNKMGSAHQKAKSPKNASKKKSDLGPSSTVSSGSDSIDLFFDLPARVISKLFRPKRPLCGQPLTLNVSGTTFCCRAELFDSQPSTIGGGENHPLVLFSVIVALAPVASSAGNGMPSSDGTKFADFGNVESSSHSQRSDATFITVRSVHRNLAKICRVLTREELRCRYVSRQCNMLLDIRKDYESRLGPDNKSISAGSDGSGAKTAASGGDVTSKKDASTPPLPPHHPPSPKEKWSLLTPQPTKVKDASKTLKATASDDDENLDRPEMTIKQRREYVQNLIEILIAAAPPPDDKSTTSEASDATDQQHGNLARELAQIFHWMSSPVTRISSQEGVVYINRHIAVPLEQVHTTDSSQTPRKQNCIRPYHALLFPSSSPSEVLKSVVDGINDMTTSPSISHSLRRILPHIQPRKSLQEIAWDAGLSLPHVMDAATWLVMSGFCVASMPILRRNRYACVDGVVPKMSSLALPFWQTFGARCQNCKFYWGGKANRESSEEDDDIPRRNNRNATTGAPHIFVIVSALTTKTEATSAVSASPTLGEAIGSLTESASLVGTPNLNDRSPHFNQNKGFQYSSDRLIRPASSSNLGVHMNLPSARGGAGDNTGLFDSVADEVVYAMAVWLVANKIIVEVKEFLVAVDARDDKKDPSSAEESLYIELLQAGCLNGSTSIPAISYQFGLDRTRIDKFISWAQGVGRVRIVSRVAGPNDQ